MDSPSFFEENHDIIGIITNTSYPDKSIFQSIEEELFSEAESNLCLRKNGLCPFWHLC